jgi:hypothetical protein
MFWSLLWLDEVYVWVEGPLMGTAGVVALIVVSSALLLGPWWFHALEVRALLYLTLSATAPS